MARAKTEAPKSNVVDYDFLKALPEVCVATYREGETGEYFSTWCPWHEDSRVPSLLVYKNPERWRCLAGCGEGPSLMSLWKKLQTATKPDSTDQKIRGHSGAPYIPPEEGAMREIAEKAHAYLTEYPELGYYLRERGVAELVDRCMLGYWRGWITIPIIGMDGSMESLVIRSTPALQESTGLRFHSPSLPPKLYAPNWSTVVNASFLFVVFGMFDALSLESIGYPAVCSTHGNNSLSHTWFLSPVLKDKLVILISDKPDHELEEVREKTVILQRAGVNARLGHMWYPEMCKDPNDILMEHGPAELRRTLLEAMRTHA